MRSYTKAEEKYERRDNVLANIQVHIAHYKQHRARIEGEQKNNKQKFREQHTDASYS